MGEKSDKARRGRALLVAGAGLAVVTVGCGPFVSGNLKAYPCYPDGGGGGCYQHPPDAGAGDAGPDAGPTDGGSPDGGDAGP